jgi:hypothetical protein
MFRFVALAIAVIMLISRGAPAQDITSSTSIATGSSTARTMGDRAAERINVKDYGAKCDATLVNGAWQGTDDAPAFASALAQAYAQGKPLYIPGGTGACLQRSANPLKNITGRLKIMGDGMDVSRIIWLLDDPSGSLENIVGGGTGYVVGDILTAVGGTGPAMKIKVLGAGPGGVVTQATAWGRSSYTTLPPYPTSVTGGSGTGATFQIVAGSGAIGSPFLLTAAARPSDLTIDGIGIIGQGQQNPQQSTCADMAINIFSFINISIVNTGLDYSRCMSITARLSDIAIISGNRVRWSSRDSINVSSAWTLITNNMLEHGGDDGIATPAFPSYSDGLPSREGVVIANNYLTDTQGIVSLGSNSVSITGNTLVRPKLRAINIGTGVMGGEGATPTRSITISGNVVSDLLTVTGDPISSGITSCIIVGSTPAIAGTAPAIPGFPVSGTGEFVSPYPYYNQTTVSSSAPMPAGTDVTITGNSCARTLNASPNSASTPIYFSSLGLGLIYSSKGWIDFPMLHSNISEGYGVSFQSGIFRNVRISGNTFSSELYGFAESSGVVALDVEIRDNTFKDVTKYGIYFVAPVSLNQRITFDGNLFDGDPFFSSVNRASTGTAPDGNPEFNGTWSGSLPTLSFNLPLTGIEFRNNKVRNWASLGVFPSAIRTIGNTIYAAAGTGVGGTLPPDSEGWSIIAEDSNPASATYGQSLGYVAHAPISFAGSVNSLSIGAAGSYILMPTVTIGAPLSGATATASATLGLSQWSLIAGGSGYAVNDFVNINAGTCTLPWRIQVTSVGAGGAVTGTQGISPGSCTSTTPDPKSTTASSGSGSGATFNASGYVSGLKLTSGGSGYTFVPTVTLSPSDKAPPFNTTATATATIGPVVWTLGMNGTAGASVSTQGAFADGSKIRLTATGAAYTIPGNTSWLAMVQTGTLASQAITMPPPISDGQVLRISTVGAITALTLTPLAGTSIVGAPTTLAAGSGVTLGWDAPSNQWLRIQ